MTIGNARPQMGRTWKGVRRLTWRCARYCSLIEAVEGGESRGRDGLAVHSRGDKAGARDPRFARPPTVDSRMGQIANHEMCSEVRWWGLVE
jgi:hypothetical protein